MKELRIVNEQRVTRGDDGGEFRTIYENGRVINTEYEDEYNMKDSYFYYNKNGTKSYVFNSSTSFDDDGNEIDYSAVKDIYHYTDEKNYTIQQYKNEELVSTANISSIVEDGLIVETKTVTYVDGSPEDVYSTTKMFNNDGNILSESLLLNGKLIQNTEYMYFVKTGELANKLVYKGDGFITDTQYLQGKIDKVCVLSAETKALCSEANYIYEGDLLAKVETFVDGELDNVETYEYSVDIKFE